MLTLRSAEAEVGVVPDRGAGLAGFRVRTASGWSDVLRPSDAEIDARFPLASILLAPWSNRISGGGFEWRGAFHGLAPNVEGERFPIHGNAFGLPWEIDDQTEEAVTLSLRSVGPGPYRYEARAVYALDGARLDQRLRITNVGDRELPFGLGFHPWFRRGPDTRLMAPAGRVWREDAEHMPAGWTPPGEAGLDFARAAPLPDRWVNNLFTLWTGRARIEWPDAGLRAEIVASGNLSGFILYSPSPDCGYFCFEPVSHVIDAHNARPDWPEDMGPHGGLAPLAPGDALEGSMSVEAGQLQPGT
jgi:aldose 1-epimerase